MTRQDDFATVTLRPDGTYSILQLTDFHNDAGLDFAQRTYDDIRAIVANTGPDLLAVTGDIWCGDETPEAGPDLMARDLDFFASLGVPWVFVWGNHDYIGGLSEALARIAQTPGAIAPRGDGRGSFRVEVRGHASSTPVWDIFCLNSGLEWDLPEDLAWFERESARIAEERGKIVPAIVYVHIPLKEYETARLAGTYEGVAQEEVLHWGDDGRVFQSFKQAGNVRACFTGHSHVNDFHFEVDGIVLAYGRATGHGGYGGEKLAKGAKLVTLDAGKGEFRFETVMADGEGAENPIRFPIP